MDGSLTLLGPGARALTASPINPPDCTLEADWSTEYYDGVICPPGSDFVRLTMNRYLPEELAFQNFTATNDFGTTILEYVEKRSTNAEGHMIVFPVGSSAGNNVLNLEFENASAIVNISYHATSIGIGVSYISYMFHFSIKQGFINIELFSIGW